MTYEKKSNYAFHYKAFIYQGICLYNISTLLISFFPPILTKIYFHLTLFPIHPHLHEYTIYFIIAGDPFPYAMVITFISTLLIAVLIIGLAVSRYYTYYNRRRNQSKDLSYSVSRYWRRQFASTSFDSLTTSPPVLTKNTHPSTENINETARIIKSSFSWPEATIHHQQQQEKLECSSTISSTSLSNSSTMEHFNEPTTLTFGLRWDEVIGSLFVRVINARDLLAHYRNRQLTLIDSYVRVELLSTERDDTQGRYLF